MKLRDLPDWAIAAGFASIVVVAGVVLVANGVSLTHEDGFYYFKIAQQVAGGHGSTFDGQNPTNGYHPLWLLLLVPLFWLAPSAPAALTAGVLVQVGLSAVAVVLVYLTARLLMGRVGAVVAAQLWLVFAASVTLGGQEFAVESVMVLATAYLYLRTRPDVRTSPVATYGGLGLLLGLSALARLETFALAAMIGGWLAWPRHRLGHTAPTALHLAAFGLPVLLMALAYLAANIALIGEVFPVSAAVKREWSATLLADDAWFQESGWWAAKARHLLWPLTAPGGLSSVHLALGLPLIAGLWSLRWLSAKAVGGGALLRLLTATSPFIAFGLVQATLYTVLYHGSLSHPPHYFVVQPWLAALLVGSATEDGLRRLAPATTWAPTLATAALLIVPVGAAVEARTRHAERQERGTIVPLHDAAHWVSQNVPDNAVVGSWNARCQPRWPGQFVGLLQARST